jgi:Holliday junction resolvase RusA-like endonuclease|nr:MAG TPA: Endodeoxyribonuclease RusA [Caudoviricetes sp.]
MSSVSFDVWGKVRGKGRPRFTRGGHAYTPKATRDYEAAIREAYMNAPRKPREPFSGPIAVSILTYRQLPKSTPKSVFSEPDTHKPDIDNVAKVILDALNGVAWEDDAQVVSLTVSKLKRTRSPEKLSISIHECIC